MPSFPAARTVPGAFWVLSPVSWTANTFTVSPFRISVEVAGQGVSPRTWSWMALAGLVQSMGDRARDSRGAKVTLDSSWGVRAAAVSYTHLSHACASWPLIRSSPPIPLRIF